MNDNNINVSLGITIKRKYNLFLLEKNNLVVEYI